MDRLVAGFDLRVLAVAKDHFQVTDDQVRAFQERLMQEIQMPIPYNTLALQDCVNLAIFFVRTTISSQN